MRSKAVVTWAIDAGLELGAAGPAAQRELQNAISDAGGQLSSAELSSPPTKKQGRASRLVHLDLCADDLPAEGYRIASRTQKGKLQIRCSGRDRAGLLFAAYDLADRIRRREPVRNLSITEVPCCTHRQITTHICNHDFLTRLVKLMPRWRMNALLLDTAFHVPADRPFIQFYGSLPITYRRFPEIKAMIEASPDFQYTQESFPRLLKLARDFGVQVFLRFLVLGYTRVDASGGHYAEGHRGQHMRKDFPHLFTHGSGNPDWESPAVWQFVRGQLEELFDLYPDLAGVTVQTDEMACFPTGHVDSPGTPEERRLRTRRIVETVEEVCARYAKRSYWDVHGSGNAFLEALVEIARERPDGLRLRAESVPIQQVFADGFPSYPFAQVAEAGDGMADHDIQMEGLGDYPWLPTIVDRYIVRHTLAAIAAGLRGGAGMWYIHAGPFYSPLNSLSQANMELLGRLLWNPQEPIDDIWDRWLRRRFGQRAATAAGRLLRSTQEVLNGILYFNDTNASFAWFQFGFPKNLDYFMTPPGWRQAIECFQPPGTPLYADPWSAVCKERAIPMSQMREEKQEAVRRADNLLQYLVAHERDFTRCDYRHLLPRYAALVYYARAAAHLVEALYHFTHLHLRPYDPDCKDPRGGLQQAIQALMQVHREMQEDDRLLLLEPDVYYRGLKSCFMDCILTLVADLRFYDHALGAPESEIACLPVPESSRARKIIHNARLIREKFERNVHLEVGAEELWARALGDVVVESRPRGLFAESAEDG